MFVITSAEQTAMAVILIAFQEAHLEACGWVMRNTMTIRVDYSITYCVLGPAGSESLIMTCWPGDRVDGGREMVRENEER